MFSSSSEPYLFIISPQRLKEVRSLHGEVIRPRHRSHTLHLFQQENVDPPSTKSKIKSCYWHSCFDPTEVLSEDQKSAVTRHCCSHYLSQTQRWELIYASAIIKWMSEVLELVFPFLVLCSLFMFQKLKFLYTFLVKNYFNHSSDF